MSLYLPNMKNGPYELVVAPDDYPGFRYRGRYVYEHHLVWWHKTGNLVPAGSLIHHVNHEKRDNRFENLELKERAAHAREHNRERHGEPEYATTTCAECGSTITVAKQRMKERLARAQLQGLHCSKSCSMKHQIRTGIGGGTHDKRLSS